MSQRLLVVRADAGESIGVGHASRCLALCEAWRTTGGRAVLLGRLPRGRLTERAAAIGVEHVDYLPANEPAADNPATIAAIEAIAARHGPREAAAPPWLAADGYHLSRELPAAAKAKGWRVLWVEDAIRGDVQADLRLVPAPGAESTPCRDGPPLLLLGPRFAPIGAAFRQFRAARPTPSTVQRILVTMGGSDPAEATPLAVEAIARAGVDAEVRVVAGPLCRRRAEIEAACRRLARCTLLAEVADVAPLFAWADLAITAAGTTCCELAMLGVPAIAVVAAENQLESVAALEARGTLKNLGWASALTPARLGSVVAALAGDVDRRRAMSAAGPTLVDGEGAARVVAMMLALDGPLPDALRLRPVCQSDLMPLWRLSNEAAVRASSICTEAITLDEHRQWFAGRLAGHGSRTWVLDLDGVVLGQVRYDLMDGFAEVSLSIVPAFRRRGLARRLIDTAPAALAQLGATRVRAHVRIENDASRRTFRAAGFVDRGEVPLRGVRCRQFIFDPVDDGKCRP